MIASPLVIVQPCVNCVIGTRFLVRFNVASAYSPLGCHATPIIRLAPGAILRSSTIARAVSIIVTSATRGLRKSANREYVLLTSSDCPSGDSAIDHGPRLAESTFTRSHVSVL